MKFIKWLALVLIIIGLAFIFTQYNQRVLLNKATPSPLATFSPTDSPVPASSSATPNLSPSSI